MLVHLVEVISVLPCVLRRGLLLRLPQHLLHLLQSLHLSTLLICHQRHFPCLELVSVGFREPALLFGCWRTMEHASEILGLLHTPRPPA